jgi:hypothetical protein
MLFQNFKTIGEELSEICVLFCKYIYIFIYIDYIIFYIIYIHIKKEVSLPHPVVTNQLKRPFFAKDFHAVHMLGIVLLHRTPILHEFFNNVVNNIEQSKLKLN